MAHRTGRTVVIGGGAAGIAAARRLWDAGEDVLIVEAGNRLGGRARSLILNLAAAPDRSTTTTVTPAKAGVFTWPGDTAPPHEFPAFAGMTDKVAGMTDKPGPPDTSMTVDAGCGWLHSARRNPWTRIAERSGAAIDRSSPNWGVQWRDLGYSPAEQQAFGKAWDRWETAARAAADGPDQSLSAFIAADDPWRPMIDAISGYANGAPLTAVSLHDWLAYEDASTADNWALPGGYGTLIAGHAGPVPVRLDTIVTRIDHRGTTLRIETDAGTIEADRAIVCVPTTALAAIAFDPPLPAKLDAAAALPLGLADKVFLQVDRIDWPANSHLIGNPHSGCSASHRLSPFGWPIIESFFGGDCAEALEGEGAAADFAVTELVALLGSDWRARLTPLAATRWRHEPHIHGSYSHALVGHAGDRQIMAAPVDNRLFFAGEACSRADFSTAHGAYETGVAAADAILATRTQRA